MELARGFWDELTARFPRFFGEQLKTIEDETESTIESLLKPLSLKQLQDLLASIRVRRTFIDTNAAYGNEVVSTSKQILAFGGAGIGLVGVFAHNLADLPSPIIKLICVAALFYLDLIGLSLFTILQFIWLTRFRYPFLYFKKIGNSVPFFYYQAISPDVPRSVCQTAEQKLRAAELYGQDLIRFVRHLIPELQNGASASNDPEGENRLKRIEARDELQQYFLLIAYQGYVNQYEVRMNNQFFYGLAGSIIAACVTGLCIFLFV